MATDMNEDDAYGRSLTYWAREKWFPLGPLRSRTSPTWSTSTMSTAVQSSLLAIG